MKENSKVTWKYGDFPGDSYFSFDNKKWYAYPEECSKLTQEEKDAFERAEPETARFLSEHGWW